MLVLGEFNTDKFNDSTDPLLLWILFVACSLFTTIMLLNMLIAIMGESFNRVNEQSKSQRVREHLQLIVENIYLKDPKKLMGKVKYLICVRDDKEEKEMDEVTQALKSLKKSI